MTNVVAALWSSEVLRDLRRHPTIFRAVCPDPIDAFAARWGGGLPNAGTVTSTLVLFDPIMRGRSDRRCFVGLDQADTTRGRYRGYADALEGIRGVTGR